MATPFPAKMNALRRLKATGLQIGAVLGVGAQEQTLELRVEFSTGNHVLFEPAEDFHASSGA